MILVAGTIAHRRSGDPGPSRRRRCQSTTAAIFGALDRRCSRLRIGSAGRMSWLVMGTGHAR
jgi:hypothetical protein